MQRTADLLEKLGLGQYAQRFAENDIDFAILSELTDQDLEKIGVPSLGHRRKLLRAIADLKDRGVPKLTAAASVAVAPPPHEVGERRQVTVMFSDLVGSTALSARMQRLKASLDRTRPQRRPRTGPGTPLRFLAPCSRR